MPSRFETPSDLEASAPRSAPTTGLTVDERRVLLAWVEAAQEVGIDATEDLRLRPWPLPVEANVIGVFRAGENMAAWLIVGQGGAWIVVSVLDGCVLATTTTLADALASVHSRGRSDQFARVQPPARDRS